MVIIQASQDRALQVGKVASENGLEIGSHLLIFKKTFYKLSNKKESKFCYKALNLKHYHSTYMSLCEEFL